MSEKNVCPECGGRVQATKVMETDFTLRDGLWECCDSETMDIRVYCENDHVLNAEDFPELSTGNMLPISAITTVF